METLNLTFDDGPDRTWTARVLQQLRRCGVTATFFVVGERITDHEEVLRDVVNHGHDVQLHCHCHVRHTQLTEAELDADTGQAVAALARVGLRPRLWRPPWGVVTEASVRVAERHGLWLRRWSIDTHDWRGDSAGEMLADAEPRLPVGGAVLMHDGLGPGSRRGGCENTVALIPGLVAAARAVNVMIAPMAVDGPGRPAR